MTEKQENKAHTTEEFAEAYKKLCAEYGYAIAPQLGWKQQIDGTFTVSVQLSVVKAE